MSNVVCGNQNCAYNTGVFCSKKFVGFNNFGQCKEWFNKNGQMIPGPQKQQANKKEEA